MPALKNPRHEAFAQALARSMSASAAYVEAGYKANRHNAAALARKQHIGTRVAELQEEKLAIHQQATAAAAANKTHDRRKSEHKDPFCECKSCGHLRQKGFACFNCGWEPKPRGQGIDYIDDNLA